MWNIMALLIITFFTSLPLKAEDGVNTFLLKKASEYAEKSPEKNDESEDKLDENDTINAEEELNTLLVQKKSGFVDKKINEPAEKDIEKKLNKDTTGVLIRLKDRRLKQYRDRTGVRRRMKNFRDHNSFHHTRPPGPSGRPR